MEPPQAVWSVNSQWVTSQLSAICWCWGKRARVGAVWLWSWLLPTQLVNQNQLFTNSHGQMRCLPTIHWDAIFLYLVRLFTAFSYEDCIWPICSCIDCVSPLIFTDHLACARIFFFFFFINITFSWRLYKVEMWRSKTLEFTYLRECWNSR